MTTTETSDPPKVESDASIEAVKIKENPKHTWFQKNRKLWFPVVLVAPYLIGLVWHVGFHPTMSIFTGDFSEARRWYIDENSLDPSAFRMNKRYNVVRSVGGSGGGGGGTAVDSICAALDEVGVRDDGIVTCQDTAREALQVVSIVPSNTAISPSQEAVVIVIPFSHNWMTSQLHYSILQLIKRLSTPDMSAAPWMGSKTIVLVSPRRNTTSLHDTVQTFLELESSCTYMIRNLLVLDLEEATLSEASRTMELRVLPQGRHGVLPNMDLVFLMYRIYSQISSRNLQLTIHTYSQVQQRLQSTWWWRSSFRMMSHKWQTRLLDLFLFEYTLIMGGTSIPSMRSQSLPHALALDHGIDALTLQLYYHPSLTTSTTTEALNNSVVIAEVVSKLEPVLRAFCNLHERLHHSTRLYLLVSPDRFVKHEEYLVPNLLLLIPLIVRAVTLILVDVNRIDLTSVARAVQLVVGGGLAGVTFGLYALAWVESHTTTFLTVNPALPRHLVVFIAVYLPLFMTLMTDVRARTAVSCDPDQRKSSIQFVTCLAAIYLHVAITFGHVSLAFPSALLWTPLIAFPSYYHESKSQSRIVAAVKSLARWAVIVATSPFLLVPTIFPMYTPYVQFLYLPLHLLVAMLWL